MMLIVSSNAYQIIRQIGLLGLRFFALPVLQLLEVSLVGLVNHEPQVAQEQLVVQEQTERGRAVATEIKWGSDAKMIMRL